MKYKIQTFFTIIVTHKEGGLMCMGVGGGGRFVRYDIRSSKVDNLINNNEGELE